MSATVEVARLSHDARILSMDADGNYTSAEVDYIVKFSEAGVSPTNIDGPNLEELALNAVRVEARAVAIGNLKLSSVTIRERLAPSAFRVTAIYGESDESGSESGSGSGQSGGGSEQDGDPQMSYECSAQSRHVTIANRQGIVYLMDQDPKYHLNDDLGNIIGWNCKYGDDFAAEGCDTPIGTAMETWTKRMSYSRISTAKKIKWGETVGCVNKAAWKGWPPRCAMFMGASFSKDTNSSSVLVSFHFAVGAPNETITMDGKNITVKKSPFDYIWALTDEAKGQKGSDPNARPLPVTRGIVVSEVVREADFNVLGI